MYIVLPYIFVKYCLLKKYCVFPHSSLLKLSVPSFVYLLQGLFHTEFLKQNEFEEAERFLEEMINRGFCPDSTTFSMLLHVTPSIRQDSSMLTVFQKLISKK
ncbi:hypothetical protein QVD17_35794 [Tagetes erecta]|uniref:Pentatricopeptide repeat-containing protein n=1 Tax=Tagetes erecta TaxID=13708 RepID=A0AAD8JSU9_TARER|nr:hypothetical protein QVD17_35794 [Tagetes erecta]